MADFLDPNSPPEGFKRSRPGWIQRKTVPQNKMIAKLQDENIELKARLAALEDMVASLAITKKAKK